MNKIFVDILFCFVNFRFRSLSFVLLLSGVSANEKKCKKVFWLKKKCIFANCYQFLNRAKRHDFVKRLITNNI